MAKTKQIKTTQPEHPAATNGDYKPLPKFNGGCPGC